LGEELVLALVRGVGLQRAGGSTLHDEFFPELENVSSL
jgi:hypothetical protein